MCRQSRKMCQCQSQSRHWSGGLIPRAHGGDNWGHCYWWGASSIQKSTNSTCPLICAHNCSRSFPLYSWLLVQFTCWCVAPFAHLLFVANQTSKVQRTLSASNLNCWCLNVEVLVFADFFDKSSANRINVKNYSFMLLLKYYKLCMSTNMYEYWQNNSDGFHLSLGPIFGLRISFIFPIISPKSGMLSFFKNFIS